MPGVITASGRLEWSYEPDDRIAGFRASFGSINFGSSNLAAPITRTVTIRNPGETQLPVFANTEGDTD